jgi:hypothetical protein
VPDEHDEDDVTCAHGGGEPGKSRADGISGGETLAPALIWRAGKHREVLIGHFVGLAQHLREFLAPLRMLRCVLRLARGALDDEGKSLLCEHRRRHADRERRGQAELSAIDFHRMPQRRRSDHSRDNSAMSAKKMAG